MASAKKAGKGDRERIESDIAQFRENVKEVKVTAANAEVVELAKKYCEDAAYFLGKKDYVTAFGCINYAHGLIDAIRKPWRNREET
jgi:uncharacterized protein